MSQGQDSGEKSQKATPKRLRDARRDGQVAHSQDLTKTAVLLAAVVLLLAGYAPIRDKIQALAEQSWRLVRTPGLETMQAFGVESAITAFWLTAAAVAVLAIGGVLAELMHIGPLFSTKTVTPDINRLNPAEGVKRMFSLKNFVDVLLAIFKTAVLFGLIVFMFQRWMPELMRLPTADLTAVGAVYVRPLLELLAAAGGIFVFVAIGDLLWQRYYHQRQLRMSFDEVKREHKEEEGDPHLKGQRRQLQRRWATQDVAKASKKASAMVVNPTHIAIALHFDMNEPDVPIVTAKGHDDVAAMMRKAAESAGVPIVRNVALARALDRAVEIEDPIPEELFDAVAEVLVWAQQRRQAVGAATCSPT